MISLKLFRDIDIFLCQNDIFRIVKVYMVLSIVQIWVPHEKLAVTIQMYSDTFAVSILQENKDET